MYFELFLSFEFVTTHTSPIQPVFLKLFAVITVKHLVHGYDVGGVHASGSLGLADRWAYNVRHFGEQVKCVVGGVLDGPGVELL